MEGVRMHNHPYGLWQRRSRARTVGRVVEKTALEPPQDTASEPTGFLDLAEFERANDRRLFTQYKPVALLKRGFTKTKLCAECTLSELTSESYGFFIPA